MKTNHWRLLLTTLFVLCILLLLCFITLNKQQIEAIEKHSSTIITQEYTRPIKHVTDYSEETFIFATGEYPPFVYSEGGHLTGLDYDILIAVLNRMNISYDIQLLSWARGQYLLDSGEIFGVFPYNPTHKRMKQYLFSSVFFEESNRNTFIYVASEDIKNTLTNETKISNLKNYKLGGIYGYFYLDDLEKNGFELDLSVNELECINKLVDGKTDLILMDEMVGDYLIKDQYTSKGTTIYKTNIAVSSFISGEYLMLNQKNSLSPEFLNTFNQILDELNTDGTIGKILDKYHF